MGQLLIQLLLLLLRRRHLLRLVLLLHRWEHGNLLGPWVLRYLLCPHQLESSSLLGPGSLRERLWKEQQHLLCRPCCVPGWGCHCHNRGRRDRSRSCRRCRLLHDVPDIGVFQAHRLPLLLLCLLHLMRYKLHHGARVWGGPQ